MAIITLNNNSLSSVTALPAGVGGKVLQVVSFNASGSTSTTSTSFVNSNLTTSITPTSSSNKILINFTASIYSGSQGTYSARYSIFRGDVSGTNLGNATTGFLNVYNGAASGISCFGGGSYLDSPNTTSSTTYTVGLRSEGNNAPAIINGEGVATITLMEIEA